jgi:hypothetical protein
MNNKNGKKKNQRKISDQRALEFAMLIKFYLTSSQCNSNWFWRQEFYQRKYKIAQIIKQTYISTANVVESSLAHVAVFASDEGFASALAWDLVAGERSLSREFSSWAVTLTGLTITLGQRQSVTKVSLKSRDISFKNIKIRKKNNYMDWN